MTLAACALIVLFAAVVRGFSGFGFSALTMIGFSQLMPPAAAAPLVLAMEVAASVAMLPGVWREIDRRWMAFAASGVLLSAPAGVYLLAHIPAPPMRAALAVALIALALATLAVRPPRAGGGDKAADNAGGASGASGGRFSAGWSVFAIGLFAGFVNGASAFGGLAAAVFLLRSRIPAAGIRATLIGWFFLTDIYAFVLTGHAGLWAQTDFRILAAALPALFAGVFVGARIFRGANPARYRPAALAIIIIAAALSGLRAALEMARAAPYL